MTLIMHGHDLPITVAIGIDGSNIMVLSTDYYDVKTGCTSYLCNELYSLSELIRRNPAKKEDVKHTRRRVSSCLYIQCEISPSFPF